MSTLLPLLLLAGCTREPTGELVTVDDERSLAAEQGVLVTSFFVGGDAFAILVDGEGVIRWSRAAPSDQRVIRVKESEDGTVLLGFNQPAHEELDGLITRETLDGEVLSETVAPSLHHDIVELPGGRLAFLGHDFGEYPIEDHGTLPVVSDHVSIGEEGGDSTVQWGWLTDYDIAPYWPCPHMVRGDHIEGYDEWTHTNSLVPTEDGGWLVMGRWLDALVKLDADFHFVWQLGGEGATIDTGGEPLFRHAHFSHAYDDRILVFDNGWPHTSEPPASRVVEIEIDEAAGTARTVWTYPEPEGRYVSFLGDAKRLPNGNTLISWGDLNRLQEVTEGGETVWQVSMDRTTGRADLWDGPLP